MCEFDHLREQAMWDFQNENQAPPTARVVGLRRGLFGPGLGD